MDSEIEVNIIPTYREPRYRLSTTIDGVLYNLRFRFNERANKWFMDVYDSKMERVHIGITLLPNKMFIIPEINEDGVFYYYRDVDESEATLFTSSDAFFLPDSCHLMYMVGVK